ncbi:MAG: ribosomal RNA adenine dimethylase domain-containing protein [Candidatus Hydrogenedentes bacterium]|nr:ribosomal RNA adenine dimethylase domain-containing protein [Candidatus Hydrogenedentota bacterium]
MSTLSFMREVIRANRSTGAIAPSGRKLADVVTDMAGVDQSNVIVEYGPGTGVFTETILSKKKPDAYFIALEVNEEFVKVTRDRCPGVHVYHDCAQNAGKYLAEAGLEGCDTIVSGLPWTRFDSELQDDILKATYDVLVPGGRFVTFAFATSPYIPSGRRFFRHKLLEQFGDVKRSERIWKNFPPCVVYIAEKR